MPEQIARAIGPDAIDIAYQRFGNDSSPPVILIMGLGGQLVAWPDGFIDQLVARDLNVIAFDNRDAGLSTHLHDAPVPDMQAAFRGDFKTASYNLSNMAADTFALMDALDINSAHIVGLSMGGFIAQTMAIEHPARLRSLTSMMSTTGNMAVGQADPRVMAIFRLPQPANREQAMDNAVAAMKIIGSPGYVLDEDAARQSAGLAFDRGYDPVGVARQAIASMSSGDRSEKLRSVALPTLVIHGRDDLMCHVSGGQATAEAINGATLEIIDGLGHHLPHQLWPRFTSLIADHIAAAEASH